MKKILGTTIVLLGAAALSATAATVQIDLSGYDSGSAVNSSFQAYRGDPSAMANHLNEWLANSSGSVSYTHLDVYKRQGPHRELAK